MTIPALPDAPALGDSPEVFNTKAFAFVAALDDWGTAANATAVAVDADAAAADADAATATTQAGIATTKAGEATTAAGVATTKAGEAATSANLADASADAAALSEAAAAGYAASIDPATIVRLSGNQTVAGIKTFSSTPVVPDGSFTYAKMQSVAAGKVLGRDTSGAGVVQELPIAVTSGGSVGMGTGSPGGKLDVSDSSSSTNLRVTNTAGTGNRYSQIQFYDSATQKSQIYQNHNDGSLTIRNNTASGVISLLTNDTTYSASLDASGNFKFNSGYGSTVTAYGCRAWVNFNGTGTVAIRGSGNVSSITDNGVGDYTVNFATAMPDTNFAMVGGGSKIEGTYDRNMMRRLNEAQSASYVRVNTSSSNYDIDYATVSIFR